MGKHATAGAEILLDYESPTGPEVTHIRGLLLINAMDNLRSWGVFEAYLDLLSVDQRTLLTATIATSWVPIEHAVLHYETVEQLAIDETKLEDAGVRLAERIATMFLAAPLRLAKRGDGAEVFAGVLSKNDQLWERMYQGGSCRALRVGPKHLALEDRGNVLARYPLFRRGYVAYMSGLANLFQRDAHVHDASPNERTVLVTRFRWT